MLHMILLVDDDASIRNVFPKLVEAITQEYKVVLAKDGQEGYQALLDHGSKIHAVFCDGQMPKLDGPAFVQKVRENPHFEEIPIVSITSNQAMADQMAKDGKTQFHMPKPFNLEQLETALTTIKLLKTSTPSS